MPISENVSKLNVLRLFDAAISTDTTTNTPIIDLADYSQGGTFLLSCSAYTDGTYKLVIEHGDDSGLSDAIDLSSDQLVELESLKAVTDGVSALTAAGGKMAKVGVISTKAYGRAKIVSTGTTSGATIQVDFVGSPDFCPAN